MVTKTWQGLKINIVWDEAYFLAICEELPVYGTGSTEAGALEDFKLSLFELKEDLTSRALLSAEWEIVKAKIANISKD